ncbi:alpha/beta-hydrolase [Xylariomycetidae sp. FL0641]|nr:alpha/beta-hydrolase [Xylariomycetidae sp. FL0641]
MPQMSDLAVVICHGNYHTPAPYMPLVEALKARGIDAYCPQLPTSDLAKLNVGDVNNPDFDRPPPEGGYPQGEADVETVLGVLGPLVHEQRKNVLLIGHSYGGWVATEAARPEFQAASRKKSGLEGGVIGILYIGAFVIPVGESVHSFFQPKEGPAVVPPFMRFHKHGFEGLGTTVDAEKFMFNDLEPSMAQKWAAGLTASPVTTSKLTNDAYKALPCAYLVLEGDMTLPAKYQQDMVALQASKTGDFTLYRCPAGHSPHLSWTEGVVDTILDFSSKAKA